MPSPSRLVPCITPWGSRSRFRLSHEAGEPGSLTKFTVEAREVSVLHTVTRKQFDEWLARPSGTPAETAQRNDLRVLLESGQQPMEPRRRPRWH
jgi:hypothetical protein